MPSKKRKRLERPSIHPRNKYSESPPDFGVLASLYPTFQPYVSYSRDGRPRIDWTDFTATRELTRVLLHHDHGLDWWIPDGQLCPTVPNRSNYIHWIEDLLALDIIPDSQAEAGFIKGFDIGTGANCIYPLLGASLLGWRFVGTDFTDVALEWAERNVKSNPHISDMIEIRKVNNDGKVSNEVGPHGGERSDAENQVASVYDTPAGIQKCYTGPAVLVGVVKNEERFDFCMCNPPFFESIEEAGQNPRTSCGGTPEEMVCSGGELAFITQIIEDSAVLKQSFRWYTSMVGRKSNLKILMRKLRDFGVTITKTTEFVQGQTSRWGLAWSFVPPSRQAIPLHVQGRNSMSFMLEGLQQQYNGINVLQGIESFFSGAGTSCKLNPAAFSIDIITSKDHLDAILLSEMRNMNEAESCQYDLDVSSSQMSELSLHVAVFQQIPGTLLVKGSLQQRQSSFSGLFSLVFKQLEEVLKVKFCRERKSGDASIPTHRM